VRGQALEGKPHAVAVGAASTGVGQPIVVDVSALPDLTPSIPSGKPHQIPQPGYQRAKKLKRTNTTCVPHSKPILSAPAKP
jgi:hypothetical protein